MLKPLFLPFYIALFMLGAINSSWAFESTLFLNSHLSEGTYQLAGSTFLPDYEEDGFNGGSSLNDNYSDENCASYPLSSCPEGALCKSCPADPTKIRAYACEDPYLLSGDTCVCPAAVELNNPNDVCTEKCGDICIAKTCTPSKDDATCTNGTQVCDDGCGGKTRICCKACVDEVTSKPENASYTFASCTDGNGTHEIKTGWQCDTGYHQENGTCVKNCISNSCSGYNLTSCPKDGTCSSCTVTSSNCSTGGTRYKLDSCPSGYKFNDEKTACIEQDDTCPDGYSKTCDYGYTETLTYTEKGTACYVCQAKCDASFIYDASNCVAPNKLSGESCDGKYKQCLMPIPYLYSDGTTSPDIIPGKDIIGIVTNQTLRTAVALDYFELDWGGLGIDIPTIENTSKVGIGVWMHSDDPETICDLPMCITEPDGKANTDKILEFGKQNGISYPAAEAIHAYQPEACKDHAWCQAGNWYLPSTRELFGYMNYRETILAMLKAINRLPDDWGYSVRKDFFTISSNELSADEPGFVYFNYGSVAGSRETGPDIVLPYIRY